MAKFRLSTTVVGFALAMSVAGNAFAIKDGPQCESEGGVMVTVKNSDYCLVPIRPEAYRGEAYDGNQLGVSDCPGQKLNDGVWCMYPVTIRKQVTPMPAPEASEGVMTEETMTDAAPTSAGAPTLTTAPDTMSEAVASEAGSDMEDAVEAADDAVTGTDE